MLRYNYVSLLRNDEGHIVDWQGCSAPLQIWADKTLTFGSLSDKFFVVSSKKVGSRRINDVPTALLADGDIW